MAADDVEARIEAARQEGERKQQTRDFLQSLTKNDQLVKPIYNPEAFVFREKYRAAAKRGELAPTGCTHPLQRLQQYIDDDPGVTREGRPVNLFECGVCHQPIWFVDAYGNPLSDD